MNFIFLFFFNFFYQHFFLPGNRNIYMFPLYSKGTPFQIKIKKQKTKVKVHFEFVSIKVALTTKDQQRIKHCL